MNIFLDTSSLVRFYDTTEDDGIVSELLNRKKYKIYISELTRVEFTHAFMRKAREGHLTYDEARDYINELENDIDEKGHKVILINTHQAKDKIIKHQEKPLRSLDAIQLATADSLKNKCNYFMTSDEKLKKIFYDEGIKVLEPKPN